MNLRIAKKSDYKTLAYLHMECAKNQNGSFMDRLGIIFLRTYYKISLAEKNSINLIAEDSNGLPLGFNSGTMDAAEHISNIKRHKITFAISILPAIIKNPKIIYEVLNRNRFVSSNDKTDGMIIRSGARGEYWAWLPSANNQAGSGLLRQAWINIIYELGCRSFKYELDTSNTSVERYSKIFGCKSIKEFTLADGRKRAIVEQSLVRTTKKRIKKENR